MTGLPVVASMNVIGSELLLTSYIKIRRPLLKYSQRLGTRNLATQSNLPDLDFAHVFVVVADDIEHGVVEHAPDSVSTLDGVFRENHAVQFVELDEVWVLQRKLLEKISLLDDATSQTLDVD